MRLRLCSFSLLTDRPARGARPKRRRKAVRQLDLTLLGNRKVLANWCPATFIRHSSPITVGGITTYGRPTYRGRRKNCALSKLWGSRAQPSVVAKAREAKPDGEGTTRCQDPRRHPSRAASPPPAAPLQSVLSVDAWPRVSEPNRPGKSTDSTGGRGPSLC